LKPLLYIGLALALAALQAALQHWVGGGAFPLALLLPLVVYLGLHSRNVEGAVASAGVGYVQDLMSGGPKGLMTFLAVALFLFSRLAGNALDVRGRFGYAVLTLVGTFLYGAAVLGLTSLLTPAEVAPTLPLLRRVGLEALLTSLASPVVWQLLRRVDGPMVREEPGLLR
jgi:cell shape-determining protein MreD